MEQREATEPSKPTLRTKFTEKPVPENHREYLDMDTDEEEFGHQETPEPLEEVPAEPEKPQFTSEELDKLVELTKRLTILADLSLDDDGCWSDDEQCLETIREFFRQPTQLVLTIFFRRSKLTAKLGFPSRADSGLAYLLRRESWQVYRAHDFVGKVCFGSVCDRSELAILRFLEGMYAPLAFKSEHWPGIMKDQIFSNLNDFLTRATELTYEPMGILLLYVPWESSNDDQLEAAQLSINRLEKVARTWIKQIRQLLVKSPAAKIVMDQQLLHDLASEFDFWQSTYEKLTCISQQLSSDRLQSIVRQLRKLKSPSVGQLKLLAGKLEQALKEATSNLAFLHLLLDACRAFQQAKQIRQCLPTIFMLVRFLWAESPYYHSRDNIERLLCSLSVHVVKVCLDSVDIASLIFDDPKACRQLMKINQRCCCTYIEIYENLIDHCMESQSTWKVDKANVLKSIKAFEQRCRDLSEICDAIMIYGGLNKINFGGTKGNCHEIQYNHVKDYFTRTKNDMRICCDYALDITQIQWFRDMSNFMSNLEQLESTIKNLFSSLFEQVNNVDMGIETLYTLLQFRERQGFRNMLHDKWTKVWQVFYEEIKLCLLSSVNHQTIIPDLVKLIRSEESLTKDICKNYLMRLQKVMINASDWLGDCDIQQEILSKYSEIN